MRKINLLYIITKLELGGAQKQLLSLIKNLDQGRFNLFLFAGQDGLLVSDFLRIGGLTLKGSRWLERPINIFKDFLSLFEICRFIKKNNIDIVHTHSSKAGILGRLAGKLTQVKIIVHTVHGWSFNDYQPVWFRRLFIWLERVNAQFSDKLIVVSEHDRKKGLVNRIGKEGQYRLIRYGIDYGEFNITERGIREEFGLNNDLVIGMISCFKPQKSPQDFIKLASLINQGLPDVKFFLVGDGVLRSQIENLINRFGLQKTVILSGWRRDIARILSAIDIFVLTSLWEGLPISVLEAMAASKAVVATNTGGIAEVIFETKTGFLVPAHNINAMHRRLAILLKDENARKQIGKNAKASLTSEFSLENMVNNTRDLYDDLVKRKAVEFVN